MESSGEPGSSTRKVLEVFGLLPLLHVAYAESSELRPFLTEMTGLSAARIGQGNLERLRPSTLSRMRENSVQWAKEKGAERGWCEHDLEEFLSTLPKCRSGDPGLYASWVYGLQRPGELELPYTVALALELDELFQALNTTCFNGDFASLKLVLTNHIDGRRAGADGVLSELWSRWQELHEWETDAAVFKKLLDWLVVDLYAALDAEWGGQFFSRFVPAPVFLWVAPRLNEDYVPGEAELPNRNLVYRPVRRLWELAHAVASFAYTNRWPEKPVKRSELGELVELDGSIIGNYFDGTRRLSISSFESAWCRMCEGLSRGSDKPWLRVPTPMVVVAIGWQRMLVEAASDRSFKAALLLDEDRYRTCWERHRQNIFGPQAQGKEAWPPWLTNQALWSSAMRDT